jgi:hypothetical protein
MSAPVTDQAKPGLRAFMLVNLEFLRAALAGGLAWLFWRMSVGDFQMFMLFAVPFAGVGLFRLGSAIFKLYEFIKGCRKFERFQSQGAAPKADSMAQGADLRHRGLTR